MSWEIIGGIAGGLADAKRRADEDREMREYRKEASELRRLQMERLRRGMPGTAQDDDIDAATRRRFGMARGGMVGASNSEMSEWGCDCATSGAAFDWSKTDMKK